MPTKKFKVAPELTDAETKRIVKEKKKYPVTNDELMPLIFEYRRTGIVSEDLGKCLLIIARNLSSKGSFHGYTWKEDMVSDGVLTCIRYMYNFDPIRFKNPNPFAYFTSIIRNAFLNYIKKQKKHSEIKDWCYKTYSDLGDIKQPEDHFELKGIDYTVLKEKS